MRIGLLSDTHGVLPSRALHYLRDCDEIWHAGDVGNTAVIETLNALNKPLRIVYGNIDGPEIRYEFPEDLFFECNGVKVLITHIGGKPPKYAKGIAEKLNRYKPDLFICGHSHILHVVNDKTRNMLYINPGAAGNEGFHLVRTMITFSIVDQMIGELVVEQLGKRGEK